MSNDDIILPSASSLAKLTINDISKSGFGYNPSVGPASNTITLESSLILLNKRTISLTPTSNNSIFDRNIITKKPHEINLSSLSFLFCEIINWTHSKSKGIQDLENRLNGLGYSIGQKYLELCKIREGFKNSHREIKLIEMLQFIHGPFWKLVFGKAANELEKSQDTANEYMIVENLPTLNKFISIPKEYGDLNCSAFVAGIIEGALDNSGFNVNVTAHTAATDANPLRTVFLIKFDDSVLTRETTRFS
ncbi:Transport protein particle subunit trs31 [Candida viswanathii]|uniref:Trafficking protein particle complex subunit n=1 Tax=Candida viswanathii TaxID=5486 RepID=A0A367YLP8_9ASCO|nr:Transport protein particle subunit trs31 [Candida viswanathii]